MFKNNEDTRRKNVYETMPVIEGCLNGLDTMIDMFYAAMEGSDQISKEEIQAYLWIMHERTDEVTQTFLDMCVDVRYLIKKPSEAATSQGKK